MSPISVFNENLEFLVRSMKPVCGAEGEYARNGQRGKGLRGG